MKKIFLKSLLVFTSSLIFICCSARLENNNPIHEHARTDELQLEKNDSIKFPLDSITTVFTTASQYNDDMETYSFLSQNNTICSYSYKDKKLIYKVDLHKINGGTEFLIKNNDTIYVYNGKSHSISLINYHGDIIKTFHVKSDIKSFPSPLTGVAPMLVRGDNIIISGSLYGETINDNENDRKVSYIYNIKSNKTVSTAPYSSLYYSHNWGSGLLRWVYSTESPKENVMLFSFPADHFIYENLIGNNKLKPHYAGSKYFDKIPSYNRSKAVFFNTDEATKYFAESNSYANILYDKYNKVYYRIAELKTKYNGMPGWKKEISIIILNANFQIVGETLIGKVHGTNNYSLFVNKHGLHLQSNKKDENFMFFDIYKLTKKIKKR
ncbi:hypothetical protein Palpr_1561 [Paludibacter propionicigenes WB4]|uniref:DUF4221 domain-containing protein n=1 Tax=Paludibacter propionicigenes (strain DSM 17365 / JCM 13257 / WB4) TaxID=694427 RepID=E4T4R2_PALPW|nr:DUF4221 family protein [Paludibacter propionicigenes]ADQ79706.1 hypothetical protein Palpr_1561 [Paludibacter propionicigenes WB4]